MFLSTSLVFIAFAAVAEVECSFGRNIFKQSNGIFLGRFYDAVTNDIVGNQLISPLSLNYALTALSLGTDGNSLVQLRRALNQPESNGNAENAILSSYKSFTDSLRSDNNLTLATRLFVDNHFFVKKTYLNVLRNNFDAGVENVNFSGDINGATNIINKFVDVKTNHLIPYLFNKGSLTSDTSTVFVNSVYFKSDWLKPFPIKQTEKAPFYGLDKQYIVNMMNQEGYFKYKLDLELNAQLLEIPYVGGFSFLVILPKDTYGIVTVENKLESRSSDLNSSPFLDIFKDTSIENVEIHLPKFTFQQTHDLPGVLKKMGVTDIFSKSNANFQRLANDQVFINKALQKTKIKVDEYGTEAAAVTVSVAIPVNYPNPVVIPFNADHPFIYIIRHDLTNTPLFVGRFNHP